MASQNLSPLCWRAWGWKLFCQCFGEAYPAGWDSPPFSERTVIFYNLACADRTQVQMKPSISRTGGWGLPADDKLCLTQALLSASLLLETLATACSVTGDITDICWGPRGEREHCVGSMTVRSLQYVGALWYGSVAFRFLHTELERTQKLEIISTIRCLRPTQPTC